MPLLPAESEIPPVHGIKVLAIHKAVEPGTNVLEHSPLPAGRKEHTNPILVALPEPTLQALSIFGALETPGEIRLP